MLNDFRQKEDEHTRTHTHVPPLYSPINVVIYTLKTMKRTNWNNSFIADFITKLPDENKHLIRFSTIIFHMVSNYNSTDPLNEAFNYNVYDYMYK